MNTIVLKDIMYNYGNPHFRSYQRQIIPEITSGGCMRDNRIFKALKTIHSYSLFPMDPKERN